MPAPAAAAVAQGTRSSCWQWPGHRRQLGTGTPGGFVRGQQLDLPLLLLQGLLADAPAAAGRRLQSTNGIAALNGRELVSTINKPQLPTKHGRPNSNC
jgi:hypothetical protein